MSRLSAGTVWYLYETVATFASSLVFTVAAVYFVTELHLSPLQLVLTGTAMELAVFVFEVPDSHVYFFENAWWQVAHDRQLSAPLAQRLQLNSFACGGNSPTDPEPRRLNVNNRQRPLLQLPRRFRDKRTSGMPLPKVHARLLQ